MGDYVIEPLRGIEYVYSNNTKLIREVLNNRIPLDRKSHDVPVSKDVVIKVALFHLTVKDFRFELIDALILDAIASLYENGYFTFTTDMIAKIIYQNIHQRTTAKNLQIIQNRIDLLMKLEVRLNIDCEFDLKHSPSRDARLLHKSYNRFLPFKEVKTLFSANGKVAKGYHFERSPLLWEYARYKKQIIKCRYGLYQLQDKNITIESLLIMRYIHNRIELMKNKNNHIYNNRISMYRITSDLVEHGVLPACGIDKAKFKNWNDKHKKILKLIETFLDKLKNTSDKDMRIKDYQYYNIHGKEGYRIDIPKKSNKYYFKKKEN